VAETSANDLSLGLELPVLGDLGLDAIEANLHALPDHAPFEFGERTCHLEQEPAHGCGGVDVLGVQVEIDTGSLEMLGGVEQVDRGAPHAIDGPSHRHIELAARNRTIKIARICDALEFRPKPCLGRPPSS